jgi:hypothetical protein
MIRAIRRTRLTPLFIAVALLATMPASMLSLIHDDGDDSICGRAFGIHDHDAHHIGGTTPVSVPESQHCFICHSPSVFAIQSVARLSAPPAVTGPLGSSPVRRASVVISDGRAARAPPRA